MNFNIIIKLKIDKNSNKFVKFKFRDEQFFHIKVKIYLLTLGWNLSKVEEKVKIHLPQNFHVYRPHTY